MSFKSNIGTDPRVIYAIIGGDDNEDGLSLERAKATIQGAVDAVNALVPPPNAIQRASIIVSGAGVFSENITFPLFTGVDAPASTNAVSSGTIYTLSSFASYQFGLAAHSGASATVFSAASQTAIAMACNEVNITGAGTTCLAISGTTDDSFFRFSQLRLNGDGAIGVNYTASNGEPEVILFASITLEDDNVVAYIHDPSVSTARAVFDVAGITDIGSPTATTAIRVIDGHLSAFVNEINATDAIDLQGGELNIISNCIVGDITVALGSTLICEIAEHVGTLTNNGTIQGRIGAQYFGTGFVTGPGPTVVDSSIPAWSGTGGETLTNFDNFTLADNGTTATLNINSPIASTGQSGFRVSNSVGTFKGELEYIEATDIVEILTSTARLILGQGPSAGTIEILGNDTEFQYSTGGTGNAFTIDMGSSPDTNPPFIIDLGGANGATVDFFVGGRNPEGVISAIGGAFYFRGDGVDSNLYTKKSATTTTVGWQGFVSTAETTITDNAIVTWDSASETSVQQVTRIVALGGLDTTMGFRTGGVTGVTGINLNNNVNTLKTSIFYDQNNDSSNFVDDSSGGLEFRITQGGADFRFSQAAGRFDLLGIASTDADSIFTMTTFSTNGEAVSFFVGDRSPAGNIVAPPGSIYYRVDGFSSGIFVHADTSTSSNIWVQLGNVFGADSSTDTSIVSWDGTSGKVIQDNPLAILSTSASNVSINLESPSVTGTVGFNLNDNVPALQTSFLYNQSTDETIVSVAAGNGFELLTTNGNIELTSVDDIILLLSSITSQVQIIGTNHTDSNALLTFANDDGSVDIHIGADTPVGNVSATGGTLYFRDSETDSNIFIKKNSGGPSTANWNGVLSSTTGSSVTNAALRFSDTNGYNAENVDNILFVDNGDNTEIRLLPLTATGQSDLFFYNNTGAAIQATLRHLLASNDLLLQNFVGDMVLSAFTGVFRFAAAFGAVQSIIEIENPSSTATCGIVIENDVDANIIEFFYNQNLDQSFIVEQSGNSFDISTETVFNFIGQGLADTSNIATWQTTSTNGATVEVFCGSRNPEGNVNGNPGAVYFRVNGVNSDIYVHRAASAGTTGWVDLFDTGVKTSETSTTNNSIVTWDGTDASTVQGVESVTFIETVSSSQMQMHAPAVSSVLNWDMVDETTSAIFSIQWIDVSSSLSLRTFQSNDLAIESDAGMTIDTALGSELVIDSNIIIRSDPTETTILLEVNANNGSSQIDLSNTDGTTVHGRLQYDDLTSQVNLEAVQSTSDLHLISDTLPITIEIGIGDANPVLTLENSANGFDIYSRGVNPDGVVSGTNGDIVVVGNDIDNTAIYLQRETSSSTSWGQVELLQKQFLVVSANSTLQRNHNRILIEAGADIILTLPTTASTSVAEGFEQTITKNISNEDVVTISTPGFYGHTGNFVISKRGDTVSYMQTDTENVILYTTRNVLAAMTRQLSDGEITIPGDTGIPIDLTIFTTSVESYEGLAVPNTGADVIEFPDVENLVAGDQYLASLTVVVRWTNNEEITFSLFVDDDGVQTEFPLLMQAQSTSLVDEVTMHGRTLIRTGTDDTISLDTSVQASFTLSTGSSAIFGAAIFTVEKIEGA